MDVFNVKDKLPTNLLFGNESGEVLAWLVMENKWVLAFYDYNNSVWQFAERDYPVQEEYDRVSHWTDLPQLPSDDNQS